MTGNAQDAAPAASLGPGTDKGPIVDDGRCWISDQLDSVLNSVPALVAVMDAHQRYRYVNQPYLRFHRLTEAAIIGQTPTDLLSAADLAALQPFAHRALHGEVVRTEGWTDYPAIGRRYMKRVYTPFRPGGDRTEGYIAFLQDETDQRRAEEALSESEAVKSAVIDGARDCIIACDAEGRVVEFNPAAERSFGVARGAVLGQTIEALMKPADRQGRLDLAALAAGRSQAAVVEAIRADGGRFPAELAVSEIKAGARCLFTAFVRDIDERLRFERDLADLAYCDAATALPNRAAILRSMEDRQAADRPYLLLAIDIDRFSDIHSSFGKDFGDKLLGGLADRLGAELGPADRLARIGEGAFGLLFDGDQAPGILGPRLDRITAIIRSAETRSGAAVFLTASVGGAVGRPDMIAEDVLRNAEIAAARARLAGGARFVWFEQAMYDQVIDRIRMEQDLRQALEQDDQLWLAYQPITEMVTGRLAGFEALVRWTHPVRGGLAPGAFIPIAEDTGLIVALGRWVLQRACLQIVRWQGMREPGSAPLFMSINISPREVEEPDCFDTLAAVLAETGAEPGWLKIELTEGAVMRKPEESLAMLTRFRNLGVRLSIDDFGTGYSSLSYLTRFPIDSIKIDRSFIGALHKSEEDRSIVRIMIDLARLLGFDVVAEGIESAADVHLLRALACDFGQGFHFSKPLSAADAETLITGDLPWLDPPPASFARTIDAA